MNNQKIYNFKGIDLRTSELDRSAESSSDLLNVELDSRRKVRKRKGFVSESLIPAATVSSLNSVDFVQVREENEILGLVSDVDSDFLTQNGAAPKYIPHAYPDGSTYNEEYSWSDAVAKGFNSTSYRGNTYFCNTEIPLMKYDGYMIYRAGLPAPGQFLPISVSYSGGGGGGGTLGDLRCFFRHHYQYIDINGQYIYGAYTETSNESSGYTLDSLVNFNIDTKELLGFNAKYLRIPSDQTVGPTSGNDRITLDVSYGVGRTSNYLEGDTIYFDTGYKRYSDNKIEIIGGGPIVALPITAIGASYAYIDVDISELTEDVTLDYIDVAATQPVHRGLISTIRWTLLGSTSYSTGYVPLESLMMEFNGLTTLAYAVEFVTATRGLGGAAIEYYPQLRFDKNQGPFYYVNMFDEGLAVMEDYYDVGSTKGLPLRYEFIDTHNDFIVMGGTTVGDYKNPLSNQISYSDASLGGSVENFSPLSFIAVGDTYEGTISGIKSMTNSLAIFKERQVYFVTSALGTAGARLNSTLSSGIGCSSSRSIVELEGGLVFMSDRGIYFLVEGRAPKEASDLIEPYFAINRELYDYTKVIGVNDIRKERLCFYLPHVSDATLSAVLVYDYYYKEWFVWSGVDADKGLFYHRDSLTALSRGINPFNSLPGEEIFLRQQLTYLKDEQGFAFESATPGVYTRTYKPIEAYYATSWQNNGSPAIDKQYNNAVLVSLADTPWDATLSTQRNYIEENAVESVIYTDLQKTTGISVLFNMFPSKSKSARIIVENKEMDQDLLITGLEYEYSIAQDRLKGDR